MNAELRAWGEDYRGILDPQILGHLAGRVQIGCGWGPNFFHFFTGFKDKVLASLGPDDRTAYAEYGLNAVLLAYMASNVGDDPRRLARMADGAADAYLESAGPGIELYGDLGPIFAYRDLTLPQSSMILAVGSSRMAFCCS